jgi:hypothetical protein
MQYRVEVGLLILSLAFVVSFFGGLGIAIDLSEWGRIIHILEANPDRYIRYMRDAFLFCILPLAVGLAYSIIAFVRERKSPTGVLEWWLPLMVVGGFFFFCGVYRAWWTYTNYLDVIRMVNEYGSVGIAGRILKVCLAVWTGDVLWMFAGVLFMLSPVFKMMVREIDASTTNKFHFLCGKGVTTCLSKRVEAS